MICLPNIDSVLITIEGGGFLIFMSIMAVKALGYMSADLHSLHQ